MREKIEKKMCLCQKQEISHLDVYIIFIPLHLNSFQLELYNSFYLKNSMNAHQFQKPQRMPSKPPQAIQPTLNRLDRNVLITSNTFDLHISIFHKISRSRSSGKNFARPDCVLAKDSTRLQVLLISSGSRSGLTEKPYRSSRSNQHPGRKGRHSSASTGSLPWIAERSLFFSCRFFA